MKSRRNDLEDNGNGAEGSEVDGPSRRNSYNTEETDVYDALMKVTSLACTLPGEEINLTSF